jgi:hypothetical protein
MFGLRKRDRKAQEPSTRPEVRVGFRAAAPRAKAASAVVGGAATVAVLSSHQVSGLSVTPQPKTVQVDETAVVHMDTDDVITGSVQIGDYQIDWTSDTPP